MAFPLVDNSFVERPLILSSRQTVSWPVELSELFREVMLDFQDSVIDWRAVCTRRNHEKYLETLQSILTYVPGPVEWTDNEFDIHVAKKIAYECDWNTVSILLQDRNITPRDCLLEFGNVFLKYHRRWAGGTKFLILRDVFKKTKVQVESFSQLIKNVCRVLETDFHFAKIYSVPSHLCYSFLTECAGYESSLTMNIYPVCFRPYGFHRYGFDLVMVEWGKKGLQTLSSVSCAFGMGNPMILILHDGLGRPSDLPDGEGLHFRLVSSSQQPNSLAQEIFQLYAAYKTYSYAFG